MPVFSSPLTSRPFLVSTPGVLSFGKSRSGVNYATDFHLVPRLRMNRGDILLSLYDFLACSRTNLRVCYRIPTLER